MEDVDDTVPLDSLYWSWNLGQRLAETFTMNPPPIGGIHAAAKKFNDILEMSPDEMRTTTLLLVVELSTRMTEVEKKLDKFDDVPRRSEHDALRRMTMAVGAVAGLALILASVAVWPF